MSERLKRLTSRVARGDKNAQRVFDQYEDGVIGVTTAFNAVFNNTPILLNADCNEYLNSLKDESVDLVLTDPPYDISKDTGFQSCVNGNKKFSVSMDFGEWDHGVIDLGQTIKGLYRVLKKGGTAIIWYDLWKITDLRKLMEDSGFKQIRLIEWLKTNPVPINSKVNYLTNSREVAILGVKGSKPTFNSSFDRGIYEYPIYRAVDRIHPTQKPILLMEALIKKHSNEGDVVLDVFLGSGTTTIACLNTNRKSIGCELDSEMFEKMIERVKTYE